MAPMLTGNFFSIRSMKKEDGSLHAVLELNAAHAIFAGHFPGRPVVPGACLLQMIKEIVQQETGYVLRLAIAHNLKFIVPIDPYKNKEIEMTASYTTTDTALNVTASFLYDAKICCKFNGIFSIC